ncbi:hypothetical protein Salmuc_02473 [Salipiger mucosus DSM 16094]|uniref:DUF1833 domain-containing protein n=1 Tax=Salipiger mucosus DSM 16094 TaxID=1123237 RepID=S9RVU2_9RHOB|nr:hypothetical protein Salmuc_02473 [Salipiger mucosus DSM 16094]
MNARTAHDAPISDELEIALFQVEHPDLAEPVRLSTDPTQRISTDPLRYGTRSSWNGVDPTAEPYWFVLVSAELPGDQEDAPAAASLVLENVSNDIAATLRSVTTRATVHMAVVLAGSPDLVEAEYRGLVMVGAEGDAGEVVISITRQPIEEEPFPMMRMTKDRFPGLHR